MARCSSPTLLVGKWKAYWSSHQTINTNSIKTYLPLPMTTAPLQDLGVQKLKGSHATKRGLSGFAIPVWTQVLLSSVSPLAICRLHQTEGSLRTKAPVNLPLWPQPLPMVNMKWTQRNWMLTHLALLNLWLFDFVLCFRYNCLRHLSPRKKFIRHAPQIITMIVHENHAADTVPFCWFKTKQHKQTNKRGFEKFGNSPKLQKPASKKACLTANLMRFPLSHSVAHSAASNLASWVSIRHSEYHPTPGALHSLFMYLDGCLAQQPIYSFPHILHISISFLQSGHSCAF